MFLLLWAKTKLQISVECNSQLELIIETFTKALNLLELGYRGGEIWFSLPLKRFCLVWQIWFSNSIWQLLHTMALCEVERHCLFICCLIVQEWRYQQLFGDAFTVHLIPNNWFASSMIVKHQGSNRTEVNSAIFSLYTHIFFNSTLNTIGNYVVRALSSLPPQASNCFGAL